MEQGSQIVKTLDEIRRFHNVLILRIHDLSLTKSAELAVVKAEADRNQKEGELKEANTRVESVKKQLQQAQEVLRQTTEVHRQREIEHNGAVARAESDPDNKALSSSVAEAKTKLDNAQEAQQAAQEVVNTKMAELAEAETTVELKQEKFSETETVLKEKQTTLANTKTAEAVAIRESRRIIREQVLKIHKKRLETVAQFETAVMFIGDATALEPKME